MAVLFFREGWTTANGLGCDVLVFAAALALAARQLSRSLSKPCGCGSSWARPISPEGGNYRTSGHRGGLASSSKARGVGQLTGGIAHDFNNLLTVVIGNLMLAIGRTEKIRRICRCFRVPCSAAERGVSLIQRLLAFARKQQLAPRSVDIGALIAGIEDLLRRTLGTRIRSSVATAPDLPPARVDPNQLELAILNLTINARDAMPRAATCASDSELGVSSIARPDKLPPGEYVVISITDTGTGMDEATLSRAFDPFFTTKEVGSGSGSAADGPGLCCTIRRRRADPQQARRGNKSSCGCPKRTSPPRPSTVEQI